MELYIAVFGLASLDSRYIGLVSGFLQWERGKKFKYAVILFKLARFDSEPSFQWKVLFWKTCFPPLLLYFLNFPESIMAISGNNMKFSPRTVVRYPEKWVFMGNY